jgi:hypothetical protein
LVAATILTSILTGLSPTGLDLFLLQRAQELGL